MGNVKMDNKLQITAPARLASILQVFSALDDVRWNHTGNYNLINHCADDFTPDEKLLSHWLCYVTDRQTAFERVWEVGGYVLSHLVRAFRRRKSGPAKIMYNHLRGFAGKSGLRLVCPLGKNNKRLSYYEINKGPVEFASRYIPSDAVSICRTLVILDAVAGRNFTRYMELAIAGQTDQSAAIRQLAVALHFLTYADIGQVSAEDVRDRIASLPATLHHQLTKLKKDPATFFAELEKDFDSYGKKRLWCSIRDYLKSPEFNRYFTKELENFSLTEAVRWKKGTPAHRKALAVMELPGDVWNNNRIFRDGLFSPHLSPIPEPWDTPRTVREIYNAMPPGQTTFYPEQLDVTFDFVPRMCDKRNCHICMFGNGISKLCHQKSGLYCPVTLAACGYIHPCEPNNCIFKINAVAGVCANDIAKKGVGVQ